MKHLTFTQLLLLLLYSFILLFASCDNPVKNVTTLPQQNTLTYLPKTQETPVVFDNIEVSNKPVTKSQYLPSHFITSKIIKDSVGELKEQFTISDKVIDSLNAITPLFDKVLYNHLAVSFFTSLADSLHGRAYFASKSSDVVVSIMDIITSRLNEGTDIVFLVDKTGSMDDDIAEVKNSLKTIMDYLAKFNNVKVGMAFYGDKNYHHDFWYNKINLTDNKNEINEFMETYTTIGNPDVPESVNDGIVKTVEEMNWTKGNRRLMLIIGDAQSQLPPYTSYSNTQVIHKCDSMNVKFNLYPIIISSKQADIETVTEQHKFVTVFPNPANDYCHLKFDTQNTYYYEINDISGKIILNSKTNSLSETILVSDLPNGTYLVQIHDLNFTTYYSKQIIIQH